jgi:hypothetical protein
MDDVQICRTEHRKCHNNDRRKGRLAPDSNVEPTPCEDDAIRRKFFGKRHVKLSQSAIFSMTNEKLSQQFMREPGN